MIHEVTATGATVEEAFANAVKALGAPAEAEVHTEMLETPKKKILGLFGGAPAKARAYYEEPDTPKKAERTAEPKRERRTEPKPARPAKQQKPG